MKSQKRKEKYILPAELTNKLLENAMRTFEAQVSKPQMKALKTVIRGLRKNGTTIIAHIHAHTIGTKKFIEKISHHLGNMDLIATVEKKAKSCILKTIQANEKTKKRNIIAYDESDIFKPHAQCMPGLTRIRDGSTGLKGNGYIFRGVNVNGISLFAHLEEVIEGHKENKGTQTIETIKKVQKELGKHTGLYVLDRGSDDKKVIKFFYQADEKCIIRMKKNRKILNLKNNKMIKITDFKQGTHSIEIEGMNLFLHVYKKPGRKDPILLITNDKTIEFKEVVALYLKRRKVEEDFKKMKSLGLEEVRLLNIIKIQNLIALIQFIIVLGQDIYEKVVGKIDSTYEHIYLYFKNFIKRKGLTQNPTAFIKFISFSLEHYVGYDASPDLGYGLFGGGNVMKKLGTI